MFLIEEVGCKERLIIHHGKAGLDCSILILSFRLSRLPYRYLESVRSGSGAVWLLDPVGEGSLGPRGMGRWVALIAQRLHPCR